MERGLVTREELIDRHDESAEMLRAQIASGVRTSGPEPVKEKAGARLPRARFVKGDRVRTRNLNPPGHTRIPRYVRGKRGVIARDWGVFVFPDTNAHHAGTKLQHCYSVRFEARELWGKSAVGRERNLRERVLVDLWEDYLEPTQADAKPQKRAAKSKRAARTKRKQ